MNPRVKKVYPEADYRLRLVFSNDEVRLFDVKPFLHVGVFRELRDESRFRSVRAFLGTVQWAGGQDLCPDTLYESSVPASPRKSSTNRDPARRNTADATRT